jgi:alpha,alpha-trehalase
VPSILRYDEYVPEQEPLREALTTVGNGRFATRGAAPECRAGGVHYPGTYVAGVYNRLVTEVAGRDLENESLVNVPDWLPFTFRIGEGPWFDIDEVEILDYCAALDMGSGVFERSVRFRDEAGRVTRLAQRRLVHMTRDEIAALSSTIIAEDWSGTLTIRSWIDGSVENRGVERYRDLAGDHLEVLERSAGPVALLRARTVQSRIEIFEAARLRCWRDGRRVDAEFAPFEPQDGAGAEVTIEVDRGSTVTAEKVVALTTSRDRAISEPGAAARRAVEEAEDFAGLERSHAEAWQDLWNRFGIDVVTGDERCRMITDLHLFHLLQTTSPNSIDLDVGIPARGLHGEAYRGHIFWDELFVYPVLHTRVPEIARSLLLYRYRRLGAARRLAADNGYRGALFPWQSGSSGREESQVLHLNPRSGRWIPDETHRQRHIDIAVAHNAWRYYRATGDTGFLARYGAELLLEIARFWASIATEGEDGRYDIVGVVGPDEFHTSDPNWDGEGLRNNAYTNVMASWVLRTAPSVLDGVPSVDRERLVGRLGLSPEELEQWANVAGRLRVPMHDGVVSQFEGYEALEELDWDAYRDRYDDIQRLDRILEAEGDDVNRYKVSKQADVLMLLYLLSFEEPSELFDGLGVDFGPGLLERTIEYYLDRTAHGSTLSRVVHSWVLARSDRRRSMDLFLRALQSDIDDIQGGTTREGIHLGAMAGTVDLLQRGYSGMEVRHGVLRFKPRLPKEISRLGFRVFVRGRWVDVSIEGEHLTLTSEVTGAPPLPCECRDDRAELESGSTVVFETRT